MKLKLDEDGNAVVQDGQPVYVAEDGTEQAVDVAAMKQALGKANEEAAERRVKLQQAEARLKLYKDIEPDAAREALAYREALGSEIDPEKVTHQIAELKAKNERLAAQAEDFEAKLGNAGETIDRLTLGNAISGSSFIGEKVTPALRDERLFRAAYGEHLGIEDGKAVVRDAAGNVIMSETNAGQPASLDEALPKIVTDPRHLAAGNASGGGESSKNGSQGGGGKKLDFAKLGPAEQAAELRKFIEANPDKTAADFLAAAS